MLVLRYVRTSGSYLLIIFLILYVAYFTSEVCLRIQNINKYERLQSYEVEINDLANKLSNFRKDSRNVKKSLGILKDVLKDIIEIHNKSKENSLSQNSQIPQKPQIPQKSQIPQIPQKSQIPQKPQIPQSPQKPKNSQIPQKHQNVMKPHIKPLEKREIKRNYRRVYGGKANDDDVR